MFIYELDSLRIVAVNEALVVGYGWREEELLELTLEDLHPPEERARLHQNVAGVTEGLDEAGIWQHRLRDGTLIHVEIRSHTLDFDSRRCELVTARNITHPRELERANAALERTNAELERREAALAEALRESEQATALLRLAGRIAGLGGWRVDLDTLQMYWSEQTAALHAKPTGTRPTLDDALGDYLPASRARIEYAFWRCAREGIVYDELVELKPRTGPVRWVRAIGEPERNESGAIVAVRGALQDVTELVEVRAESRRAAERLYQTLNHISDGFLTIDRKWRFGFVNRSAGGLLQRDPGSLVGRHVWDEFPDAESTFGPQYRKAFDDGVAITFSEHFPPLDKWFEVTAYPTSDGLAVHFQDVTERRSFDERLRQAQKLEALGQLTGGVAHDFNNLLTVILGNAELLTERLDDQQQLRLLAEMTASAAERGAELTNRLLAFARRQALEPRRVDINRLIGGMDGLLRRTLGERLEIEVVRGGGVWSARVDPGQLEVALLNLAINARDAMPDGGRLTIETANASLDDDYAARHEEVVPGQYVMLSLTDSGHGMTPEHMARAFEPFFTTKAVGKGSGLGLSMVYGFVKQSGGHIKLYSEVGEGTTARLYLPRATADDPEAVYPTDVDEPAPGEEHVLVVEDDALVREHVSSLLEGLGYRVTRAENGHEALAAIDAHDDIALLFTDVVMPGGMDGRRLADEARRRRPALRVLYTSGYTENAIVHHGRLDAGVQLLSKPYRRTELAAKVRRVLDGD